MSGTADLADAPGGGGEAGLGGQAGQLGQSGPAAAGAPEGAVRVPPWVARANESARGGQRGRRAAAPAAGDDTAGAPLRGAGAPSAAQLRSASRGSDDQVRGDRGRRSGAQVAGGPTTGRGPDDGPGPFPGDEPGGTPGGGHGGGHEEPSGGAGQGTPRAGDRGGNDERPDGNAAARDVTSVQMSTDELVVACGISPAQLADLERFGLVSCRHVAGGRFYDDDAVVVCRLAARFAVYGIEARHLRMFKVAAEREVALYEQVVAPLTHGRDRQGASSRAADVLGQLSGLGEAMRSALVQRAARPETGGH